MVVFIKGIKIISNRPFTVKLQGFIGKKITTFNVVGPFSKPDLSYLMSSALAKKS